MDVTSLFILLFLRAKLLYDPFCHLLIFRVTGVTICLFRSKLNNRALHRKFRIIPDICLSFGPILYIYFLNVISCSPIKKLLNSILQTFCPSYFNCLPLFWNKFWFIFFPFFSQSLFLFVNYIAPTDSLFLFLYFYTVFLYFKPSKLPPPVDDSKPADVSGDTATSYVFVASCIVQGLCYYCLPITSLV